MPHRVNKLVMDHMPVCNKSKYPIQEFFDAPNPMLSDYPDTISAHVDRHFHPDIKPQPHDVFPWYIEKPPVASAENFSMPNCNFNLMICLLIACIVYLVYLKK